MQLRALIRKHRDARGNDRCHENDTDLYKAMPEGLPPEYDREMPESCLFMSKCAEYLATQKGTTEQWLSVEYDINLTRYVETYLNWRARAAEDLDLRTAFHLLSLPQKQFVAKLGLYNEEAGALPKD